MTLSPRQREVMDLVAEGFTNKEIAARLGISPRAVGARRLAGKRRIAASDGSGHTTERQRSVVRLAAWGFSVSEIAKLLSLSPHTVRHHQQNAKDALGATSMPNAVALLGQSPRRRRVVTQADTLELV